MSETSNKFNHDSHLNYVIAPHAPTGSAPSPEDGHDTTTDTQSTSTVDKHTGLRGFVETRKGKAIVFGTGVLALGGLAFGGFKVAEATSVPESHEPVATAPANPGNGSTGNTAETTPSATPTAPETATGPANYNYGLTQAEVAPLLAKDVYGLNTGSVEEKAKIAMFYAQQLPDFAKDWQAVSKDPKDVLPAEVNADNTPDEINAFITMAHRQALTLTQADGFHFDKATSDKLVAASLINGTLSPMYKEITDYTAQLDGTNSAPSDRSLPATGEAPLPIINKASDKYTDAAGRTCIDMNTTQTIYNNSAPVTSDITVCLVKNDNGSIWMQR